MLSSIHESEPSLGISFGRLEIIHNGYTGAPPARSSVSVREIRVIGDIHSGLTLAFQVIYQKRHGGRDNGDHKLKDMSEVRTSASPL